MFSPSLTALTLLINLESWDMARIGSTAKLYLFHFAGLRVFLHSRREVCPYFFLSLQTVKTRSLFTVWRCIISCRSSRGPILLGLLLHTWFKFSVSGDAFFRLKSMSVRGSFCLLVLHNYFMYYAYPRCLILHFIKSLGMVEGQLLLHLTPSSVGKVGLCR